MAQPGLAYFCVIPHWYFEALLLFLSLVPDKGASIGSAAALPSCYRGVLPCPFAPCLRVSRVCDPPRTGCSCFPAPALQVPAQCSDTRRCSE